VGEEEQLLKWIHPMENSISYF